MVTAIIDNNKRIKILFTVCIYGLVAYGFVHSKFIALTYRFANLEQFSQIRYQIVGNSLIVYQKNTLPHQKQGTIVFQKKVQSFIARKKSSQKRFQRAASRHISQPAQTFFSNLPDSFYCKVKSMSYILQ